MTEDSNLTVGGIVPAQTTIYLHKGWNLVGFPSFNAFSVGDLKATVPVDKVEGFQTVPPHFLKVVSDSDVLLAGQGYWVRVETDTVWAIEII
ncbi:MAG: hypothetical protein KAW09_11785 [Thermoplasmata archaeon]|nr:hypothetical protein [Thermoplasmata archaeon]